jgi:hypothetical protein
MYGGDMKTTWIFRSFVICLIVLALMPVASSSAAPPSGNLAPNPSFEKARKKVVTGWQGNVSNVTFTWSKGIAYSGKHSVCISNLPAQSSGDWVTSEFIPVTSGTTYTLSAYVKGDFDQEVYISVFPIDANGNFLVGEATYTSFNNTNWTYVELSWTAPPDAVAAELDLGVNNASDTATTGSICYDQVSFK